jgi:glycosyltransferase involved in cell wall biosynthesis
MTSTQDAPLLSVIMPNYNYGKFIAKAMESVYRQDYGPIELIVVDDGSTDNSVAEIEATLAKSPLQRAELVVMPENAGKLAAINRALSEIKGKYSIILDSDDILLDHYASHCIAKLEEAHKADPKVGFVYTDCNLIDESGASLDRGRSAAFDIDMLETYSYIPEPAVVLSEALLEAGPYDVSIRRGTKHHKWRRIVANGWHGMHLAEALFCYRMHSNNLSGIGKRVTTEVDSGRRGERILSGYWPTGTA